MFLRKRILNKLLFILYINLIIKNNNNYFCNYLLNEKNLFNLILFNYYQNGDWGLGIGDWGLGIGPNPQSPIPNPQSPIPI